MKYNILLKIFTLDHPQKIQVYQQQGFILTKHQNLLSNLQAGNSWKSVERITMYLLDIGS